MDNATPTTALLQPAQQSRLTEASAGTIGVWLAAKRLTCKAGALRAHMAAAAAHLDIAVG